MKSIMNLLTVTILGAFLFPSTSLAERTGNFVWGASGWKVEIGNFPGAKSIHGRYAKFALETWGTEGELPLAVRLTRVNGSFQNVYIETLVYPGSSAHQEFVKMKELAEGPEKYIAKFYYKGTLIDQADKAAVSESDDIYPHIHPKELLDPTVLSDSSRSPLANYMWYENAEKAISSENRRAAIGGLIQALIREASKSAN